MTSESRRHYLIIYNPNAGGHRPRRLDSAVQALESAGVEVTTHATEGPEHAEELARNANGRFSAVLAAGGDGTAHEVANGLMARPTPLPLGILLLNKLNAEVTVFGWLLGETMINFAIVLVIDRVSSFPDTLSARFLSLPPMVFLGHLSYSLYLWQQPFLPAAPAWVGQTFPVNIGLLFLAALASFYLIEQPFLRLKARVGGSVGRGARG